MRALAPLLYLTPLLAHIYCKDVVGIVGENVTFPVKIDKKILETVWKKNKDKVVEWEGQGKPTYFGPLYNRSVLMENGSLTIVNLEMDDAGQYEFQYWDTMRDHSLDFVLIVLDSIPEPKISCNTTDSELVLNCIAQYQPSLNYTWKLSNDPHSYPNQEHSIPLENVDDTTKATCIIKFSQIERSSEIFLSQCFQKGKDFSKGDGSSERNRGALILSFLLAAVILIIVVFLHKKGKINLIPGRTAQNNSPVNGSGEAEQLFPGNSQQQPNSEGVAFSHSVRCEDEEPEADRTLNEDDSALKGKQIVKKGVNQEEVTQDAEGGNAEHLNNSSSCSKEDLKA